MPALLVGLAFGAAFLSFSVEPMVGKLLLPTYGGTPAVWTTALVFFQVALLVGYAWAHLGPRVLGSRGAAAAQVALMVAGLGAIPVALPSWAGLPGGLPEAATGPWLLVVLAGMVGLPFVALTALGPTTARWWAELDQRVGRPGPYRLLAAGNAGSLAGLLAYPWLVEPNLDLVEQARWWAAGFATVTALCGIVAVVLAADGRRGRSTVEPAIAAPFPGAVPVVLGQEATRAADTASVRAVAGWVALAAIPSALTIGVTAHLTTDVAAVPLLWVLPLATYLVTLVLALAGERPIGLATAERLLPVGAIAVAASLFDPTGLGLPLSLVVNLGTLALAGLTCHGRLVELRPPARRLTTFTLAMATGGAVGGIAAAIVAPLVLPSPIEYPIALLLALLVRRPAAAPARRRRVPMAAWYVAGAVAIVLAMRWTDVRIGDTVLLSGLALGVLLLLAAHPRVFAGALAGALVIGAVSAPPSLATRRTFFGTYRVEADQGGRHALYAGTTVQGVQRYRDPGQRRQPAGFYYPGSPIAEVLDDLAARLPTARTAVVGLGVGAIAAYGRPADRIDIFEIDPAIVEIARDPRLFTYLADSPATITIRVGDGRLGLAAMPPASYDLIVLDAFSSDAVPVHMLTSEAIAMDAGRLRPGALLAINVANRALDLRRAVSAVAREVGLAGVARLDQPPPERSGDADSADWVVLARNPADLAGLAARPGWHALDPATGTRAWTDRYSDLLPYLLNP